MSRRTSLAKLTRKLNGSGHAVVGDGRCDEYRETLGLYGRFAFYVHRYAIIRGLRDRREFQDERTLRHGPVFNALFPRPFLPDPQTGKGIHVPPYAGNSPERHSKCLGAPSGREPCLETRVTKWFLLCSL